MGRQSADGRGAARFLRISRRADGAVGRAGRGRIHRRTPDRRDARSQRPQARPVFRHRRRPRRAGVRNGRAAGAGGVDYRQVAPAARKDAAGRSRTAPHRVGHGDQADAVARPALQRLAPRRSDRARGPESGRAARLAHRRFAARSPAGVRLHPGGSGDTAVADGDDRPGSGRLDGHGHADIGAVVEVEAALHLFQAELRPGDEPADRSDPRRAGDEPRLLHWTAAQSVRS